MSKKVIKKQPENSGQNLPAIPKGYSEIKNWLNTEMKDWDSLHSISKHYEDYNNRIEKGKKKLPSTTKSILMTLDHLYEWHKHYASREYDAYHKPGNQFRNELSKLTQFLEKVSQEKASSISRIILGSKKGTFEIKDETMISLMLRGLSSSKEAHWYRGHKIKKGQPTSKLWNTLAVHAESIVELRNEGITIQYLHEFFQFITDSEIPADGFKKTLDRALKAGQ